MKSSRLILWPLLAGILCTGAQAADDAGKPAAAAASPGGMAEESGSERHKRPSGGERVERDFKDKEITDAPPPPNRVRPQAAPH